MKLAAERHAALEDAIRLYAFYGDCDDLERWIKDKEKLLKTDDPADTVDEAKRKYEVCKIDKYLICFFYQHLFVGINIFCFFRNL